MTFAKRPRDFSYTLNKKKRRAALRTALSMLVKEGRLKVVEGFDLTDSNELMEKPRDCSESTMTGIWYFVATLNAFTVW